MLIMLGGLSHSLLAMCPHVFPWKVKKETKKRRKKGVSFCFLGDDPLHLEGESECPSLELARRVSQVSKWPYKWCINIRGRLWLFVIRPLIWKPVVLIRPPHYCTNQHIWVRCCRVHHTKPCWALDLRWMNSNRRQWWSPVMDPFWVPCSIPHHVWHL